MSSRYRDWLRLEVIVMIVLLLSMHSAEAGSKPLFLQLFETASVSDKALQKARKQIKEHKEVKVLGKLSVPPFHKREKRQKPAKQPMCMTCHLPLPHRKNKRSRTFMNMHSRYIACETCHLRPKEIPLDYRWLAYTGPQAGDELPRRLNHISIDKNMQQVGNKKKRQKTGLRKKKVYLAPQTGVRIAPFFEGVPVLLFKDSDFAQEIKRKWKNATHAEQAELKVRLHAPLTKKGPACKSCHGKEKPLLDLAALGATPLRLKAIQQNTIVRFFSRFKKEEQRIRISDDLLK